MHPTPPPFQALRQPDGKAAFQALRALIRHKTMLAPLAVLHQELGDVFRLSFLGFNAVVLVGPEANRFVHITARDQLCWRLENDPVTRLLRHGVLVEDGEAHDQLRQRMNPAFHRRMLAEYVQTMVRCTDQVWATWGDVAPRDMLVEMRRVALLILLETMFKVDFSPDMARLWPAILRTLAYISPGPWLLWPGIPRPGYKRALRQMDDYLYQMIRVRRAAVGVPDDLLGLLVTTPGMSDDLIRDQLLTMLIAGHDTSTALLAWTLYLLGRHPQAMQRVQSEIETALGQEPPTLENIAQLKYLERVIKESLRLYPPIHLGQRLTATDLVFQGYHLPADTRILYSIYLTHRQPQYWPQPERFAPDRFLPEQNRHRPAYTYLPFGGGARICIGFTFAEVEAKVVLARILQKFTLTLTQKNVHPHMGATLEPRPGVLMRAQRRARR